MSGANQVVFAEQRIAYSAVKQSLLVVWLMLLVVAAGCSRQVPFSIPETQGSAAIAASADAISYQSLYHFKYGAGYRPQAGFTLVDGALFGTTSRRWSVVSGSVVRMDLQGHVTTIHDFTAGDGGSPVGDLLEVGGKLYGTTQYGGSASGCLPGGCGTVFELRKSASGYSYRVLYNFQGGKDGQNPEAGLAYLHGVFYGTTFTGGIGPGGCNVPTGCGTVFSLTPSGKERVIHTYNVYPDGLEPLSRLKVLNGTLYGTTSYGGKYDSGTVFAMSTTGKERILWNFNGDGMYPQAGLMYYDGYLYGTTAGGGASFGGIVFKVDPSGTRRVVLHQFAGSEDGAFPHAGLTLLNGTLYGTTLNGGAYRTGTVFSVTPTGQERIIYSFKNNHKDGWGPVARLTAVNGTLYGTTQNGGAPCRFPGCGTAFKITP